MHHPPIRPLHRQAGISLIEIMIGLTIALITTLMLSQIMGLWGEQRNKVTTGSDAQTSGYTALVAIEQAVRSAGSDSAKDLLLDCERIYGYNKNVTAYTPAGLDRDFMLQGVGNFAPVMIKNAIDSQDGGSDSITTNKNDGTFFPAVTSRINKPGNDPTQSADFWVQNANGFNKDGELVIAINPSKQCLRTRLTKAQNQPNHLQINESITEIYNPSNGSHFEGDYNADPYYRPTYPTDSWPTLPPGTVFVRYQISPLNTYYVADNILIEGDGITVPDPTPTKLVNNIVNIQAQYGILNGGAYTWSDAVSPYDALNKTEIEAIQAIRLAIISRTPKRDSSVVTTACASFGHGICIWGSHHVRLGDSNSADAEWKHYRYQVYETVIPLRNSIWLASGS